MPEFQAGTSCEQILDRESPFTSKSFDPLSRHPSYTIRPSSFYPVGVLLPPPFEAARDVQFSAEAHEIPYPLDQRTARRIQPSDASILRVPAVAPRNPLRPVRSRPQSGPSPPSHPLPGIPGMYAGDGENYFSPASSGAAGGADSSAIVSVAASAPSASVAAANSVAACAASAAAAAFSAAAIFLFAT